MSMSSLKLRYVTSKFGEDYRVANRESGEIVYHCPFCPSMGKRNNDRKLYVNVNKLVWNCKRCDSSGALRRSNDMRTIDVYSDIIKWFDPSYVSDEDEVETDFFHIPEFRIVDNRQSMGYEYMTSRGFTDEDMDKYSMRVSGADEFVGRVVIPNKVVSNNWTDMYTARSYVGHSNKYKNPTNSKRSSILFNYHNIPDNPEYMILNEGMLNSIIAGDYSVASFGKSLSTDQRNLIIEKNPKKLYVSYDDDALYTAINVCDDIMSRSDIETYLVRLPEGMDAVDLGRDKYLDIVMSSKKFIGKSLYKVFMI